MERRCSRDARCRDLNQSERGLYVREDVDEVGDDRGFGDVREEGE